MAIYTDNRLQSTSGLIQLTPTIGPGPAFQSSVGATGRGVAVIVQLPEGAIPRNGISVWAQPCILVGNPLADPPTARYSPIGGTGQLIVPGALYNWSRQWLGVAGLAANATPGAQIDIGIQLFWRRNPVTLFAEAFRMT